MAVTRSSSAERDQQHYLKMARFWRNSWASAFGLVLLVSAMVLFFNVRQFRADRHRLQKIVDTSVVVKERNPVNVETEHDGMTAWRR